MIQVFIECIPVMEPSIICEASGLILSIRKKGREGKERGRGKETERDRKREGKGKEKRKAGKINTKKEILTSTNMLRRDFLFSAHREGSCAALGK